MRRFLLTALLLLAACGDTEATLDGFDTSCAVAEDCMVVLLGDICGCDCTYGAINSGEAESWADYDASLRDACTDPVDCTPCPDADLSCDAGMCVATPTEG